MHRRRNATIMILNFGTDWSGQIVQTQCKHPGSSLFAILSASFGCHSMVKPLSSFSMITDKFSSVPKFRNFTVLYCTFQALQEDVLKHQQPIRSLVYQSEQLVEHHQEELTPEQVTELQHLESSIKTSFGKVPL